MAERFGDARTPPAEGEGAGEAEIAFCADSCGRPATDERLSGLTGDVETVDLVCAWHADHPEEAA